MGGRVWLGQWGGVWLVGGGSSLVGGGSGWVGGSGQVGSGSGWMGGGRLHSKVLIDAHMNATGF